MGGVVALLVALRRPGLVRRLVLAATWGGIDMTQFDSEEWRQQYNEELPEAAPRWFVDDRSDLTAQLPSILAPALLLWGEEDRLSPPAAGRYLAGLLPHATFVTVPGAGHMLAGESPEILAAHVQTFLSA
jgi:pimeloyl-ACP methyl ester carboxylesterase